MDNIPSNSCFHTKLRMKVAKWENFGMQGLTTSLLKAREKRQFCSGLLFSSKTVQKIAVFLTCSFVLCVKTVSKKHDQKIKLKVACVVDIIFFLWTDFVTIW